MLTFSAMVVAAVTLRIFDSLKPVIGAINGAAVGIGVTMQLPDGYPRIASDNGALRFRVQPPAASTRKRLQLFLPRLVGIQQALAWCYSGRVFPASKLFPAASSCRPPAG